QSGGLPIDLRPIEKQNAHHGDLAGVPNDTISQVALGGRSENIVWPAHRDSLVSVSLLVCYPQHPGEARRCPAALAALGVGVDFLSFSPVVSGPHPTRTSNVPALLQAGSLRRGDRRLRCRRRDGR